MPASRREVGTQRYQAPWRVAGSLVLLLGSPSRCIFADGPPAAGERKATSGSGEVRPHESVQSAGTVDEIVRANQVPPRTVTERPGTAAPRADAQWVDGYWAWDKARESYTWVTGGWQVPPSEGAFWVNGYWRRDQAGWIRVPGFWCSRPNANPPRRLADWGIPESSAATTHQVARPAVSGSQPVTVEPLPPPGRGMEVPAHSSPGVPASRGAGPTQRPPGTASAAMFRQNVMMLVDHLAWQAAVEEEALVRSAGVRPYSKDLIFDARRLREDALSLRQAVSMGDTTKQIQTSHDIDLTCRRMAARLGPRAVDPADPVARFIWLISDTSTRIARQIR
jgi:hypothetical protein